MDDHRFDQLARGFGRTGWTRRGAVRALTGLALGLLLGRAAPQATAKKKGKKKPKKCKNGAVTCGKACVNTGTNALHCGGCGRRCGSGIACRDGRCQRGGCTGDQIACGGLCVDPDDNDDHCGGCNRPCNGDLTCSDEACGCADGTACGNQCVDTDTDPNHCGGCNDPCGNGQTCVGGQCGTTGCGPGQRDCGGGVCIPDDDEHCCNLADCGGQFSDLVCNATTHRCECEFAGWGRCTGQDRLFCAPCCPGSDFDLGEPCAGPNDERVCIDRTIAGCRCPAAMPNICSAFNEVKCTFDQNRDPRVCGRFCEPCAPGGICCGGLCHYGCPQATGGSCTSGPCNDDCSPCLQGSICCNFGSGPQCIEGLGTICFPP